MGNMNVSIRDFAMGVIVSPAAQLCDALVTQVFERCADLHCHGIHAVDVADRKALRFRKSVGSEYFGKTDKNATYPNTSTDTTLAFAQIFRLKRVSSENGAEAVSRRTTR